MRTFQNVRVYESMSLIDNLLVAMQAFDRANAVDALFRTARLRAETAASLAQAPPVTIGVDDPVDHVWDLMAEQKMWLLPVLDGRQLVGVIHYPTAAAANPYRSLAASDRTSTGS